MNLSGFIKNVALSWMRHEIPLHDPLFQFHTLVFVALDTRSRTVSEGWEYLRHRAKRKFCFESKLVCFHQFQFSSKSVFHRLLIFICMCIYASLFCFTWDLCWFSNHPRTPVSALGCCSLLNGGSSSLIALPVNESIKDLTDFRQDPLHHSPRCWNELWSLVWGWRGFMSVFFFFFF